MITVGGMGTLSGPIIGAILMVIFPEIFQIFAGIPYGRLCAILVLMILFRPAGLFGVPECRNRGNSFKVAYSDRLIVLVFTSSSPQ
jgi:ABC-type branched-subunit amino acid transport system permease subunit